MATQNHDEAVIDATAEAPRRDLGDDTYALTERQLKTLLLQFLMWSRPEHGVRVCEKTGNRRDGSSNYVRLNRHAQKGLIETFIEAWAQEPLMKAPRPLVHPGEKLAAINPALRDAEVDLPLEVSVSA